MNLFTQQNQQNQQHIIYLGKANLFMSEDIQNHVLAKYKVIQKIGSGAYGHVFKVIDRKTKKIKALKKNYDAFNNSTDAQRTYRQIMFLSEIKHPNIILLQQVIPSQNGKDVYLVFEYMDADLHLIIRKKMLTQRHKKYLLYQTAKALLFMHSAGVIHRDLKPSNILVNQSCDAKICDFGLVRSISQNNEQNDDFLTEYIATRWYRAPQVILGSKVYSKEIDVWSFGCLIAQIAKSKPLFPGSSTINQLERVISWTGVPTNETINSLHTKPKFDFIERISKIKKINRTQFFSQIDPQCLDLVQKCLQFYPSERPSFQQIIKHPYLSEFYDRHQIQRSKKQVTTPINDNRRFSHKHYRNLIQQYAQQKQNQFHEFHIPISKNLTIFNGIEYKQKEKEKEKSENPSIYRIRDSKSISIGRSQNSKKKICEATPFKNQIIKNVCNHVQNQPHTISFNNKFKKKESLLEKKQLYVEKDLKDILIIDPRRQKRNIPIVEKYEQKQYDYNQPKPTKKLSTLMKTEAQTDFQKTSTLNALKQYRYSSESRNSKLGRQRSITENSKPKQLKPYKNILASYSVKY